MENNENRELGLIDIMQIIGQWCVSFVKKLADWFLFLVFFGVKRWKVLLIVAVLSGAYSVVSYKMQSSQYEANMIIRCNAIEPAQMKMFFDSYSNLLENNLLDEDAITAKTGLNASQRSMISSISTYYCIDEDRDGTADKIDYAGKVESSDELLDSLNLSVKVQFEDVSILPEVSKSLVSYLGNVPYIKNSNDNRLAEDENRREFILNEISLLDELQKSAYNNLSTKSELNRADGSHIFVDNRKILLYEDKMILIKQAEVLQRKKEMYGDAVTIVDDFVIGKSAINSLSSIIKKNVMLSLIAAFFILFLIFIYKKVKPQYLPKA